MICLPLFMASWLPDSLLLLASITPEQFQTAALSWIGVAVIVITALAWAAIKLMPLIEKVRSLFEQVTRQGSRIDEQQKQITQVALQTPPAQTINVQSAPQAPPPQ